MDDETILQRGGDERDIREYAKQNGADLTEEDVRAAYILQFREKFVDLNRWVERKAEWENCEKDAESFITKLVEDAEARGRNMERSDMGEAIKQLALISGHTHWSADKDITATAYIAAYQEEMRSRYVRSLEEHIAELQRALESARTIKP